jgi:Na+/H+-dicarboxylate symporter
VIYRYLIAIILGYLCGYFDFALNEANFISEIFIKIFKLLSLPIIVVSLIVSLSKQSSDIELKKIGKQTLVYTIGTTVAAAFIASIVYTIISPSNVKMISNIVSHDIPIGKYSEYVLNIIPSNIFSTFLEHNVVGSLLIGIIIGIAIRYLPNSEFLVAHNFFKSIHGIFLIVIEWTIKMLPIAIFGFVVTAVAQLRGGTNIKGLGEYLSIVIIANIIHGIIVLPIFLRANKIFPFVYLKAMFPALSVAFFSKSSVGTLPITMSTAENNLGISREISRFVFPLCTAINMNACAAFIFTTVIYVMQNYGIEITPMLLLQWIFIATIVAIGNAGVPMGCFFLSMSLLTSMDIPIDILWLILPFYSVIDMGETALNVWSDVCVVSVIDKKLRIHHD